MKEKRNKGRRNFIRTASVAVIGAPYIVPSTVFGANAPSNRLNMGCIGTGFAWQWDTLAFLTMEDVQIIALCDVDRNRVMKAKSTVDEAYAEKSSSGSFRGVDTYNDFRELLARDDIDFVTIATPDHWHVIIGIEAVKAGKHVYCQKPLTHNIAEGRALCNVVKNDNIVWQTGSQQRSMRNFRFACELVRNERIGKLQTVEVGLGGAGGKNVPLEIMPVPDGFDYDMWLGPAPWAQYTEKRCHSSFRRISDYAYGTVTDWGAHHCDTAQWGMGTDYTGPVEIEGHADFYRDGLFDVPKGFKFTCRYANGVSMTVTDSSQNRHGIKFIGSEGWVFITRGLGEGDIDASPKSILTSIIGRDDIHLYRHVSGRSRVVWRPKDIHNTITHYRNFIDCIYSGKETAAPVEVGHRSMSVCHLGHIAMQLGRKLKWNPEKERFVNDPEADRMLSRSMRSPWRL
ncbi:Gfo/Idh/MocA family protein [Candidatus Latescibacterota bacterium]